MISLPCKNYENISVTTLKLLLLSSESCSGNVDVRPQKQFSMGSKLEGYNTNKCIC